MENVKVILNEFIEWVQWSSKEDAFYIFDKPDEAIERFVKDKQDFIFENLYLKDVTEIDDIKEGDMLLITGDILYYEPVKAHKVKVSDSDGVEIIFNIKENKYFNLGMYLEGKSWVTDIKKIIR